MKKGMVWFILLLGIICLPIVYAAEPVAHGEYGKVFFYIAIILIAAKVSSLVHKFGQPAVFGELMIGIILGSLGIFGIQFLEPIIHNNIINFLAQLGVVILLFQIGLESNIKEMQQVGIRAVFVALLGVFIPFILGTFVVGPWILPNENFYAHLFLGATLTTTSVGISARVFQDLGMLKSSESKIVLGAAVIDDVLGLIFLAIVSAIITGGSISPVEIGVIIFKAIAFLVGAVIVGNLLAPTLSKLFSKIHAGVGMKFTIAICFGLILTYMAEAIGLAGIVGAFAAGLILDAVHFKYFKDPKIIRDLREKFSNDKSVTERLESVIKNHADRHIEDIIKPIGLFLIPIFFVVTGMKVDITTLFNGEIIFLGLLMTTIAIGSKLISGALAGNCNKWIVGWGMVPRGEVVLIFATIGIGLDVITQQLFSMIIIMVVLTTILPPLVLNYLIKNLQKETQKEIGEFMNH